MSYGYMLLIGFVAAIVCLFVLLRRYIKMKEKAEFYALVSEQTPPTYFEYDIKHGRMHSSLALADLYGAFSNNYKYMVMENFPECAVTSGNVHPDDCERYMAFYDAIKTGKIEKGGIELRILNDYYGKYIWSYVFVKTLKRWRGKPQKALGIILDLNYTDKLTGIDNKYKFASDATRLLAARDGYNAQGQFAIVLVDLYNFKLFNEINGYDYGDMLLKHMAEVICSSTVEGELCAHFFSDHFILMLRYDGREELTARLEKILSDISRLDFLSDKSYTITPYAGVYVPDDRSISIDTAIDRARLAQVGIKGRGESNVAFFEETIKNTLVRRQEIENSMEASLQNKHFVIYIQPKYRLEDEQIYGGEALVRWKNADTLISPDEFIPLFEQNGFITKLDMYVFESVCKMQRAWINSGYTVVPISVNFSRLHIFNPQFARTLADIANAHGVPHHLLEIEITETIAFKNEQVIAKVIGELASFGFTLSIDDFGSGYSSLGMLKNLPFNAIKMDRSFFGEYTDINRAKAVIGNVITLSKQLGIVTVAEGVETKEHITFLRELQCDIVQGYYYAKPLPETEFTERLHTERTA